MCHRRRKCSQIRANILPYRASPLALPFSVADADTASLRALKIRPNQSQLRQEKKKRKKKELAQHQGGYTTYGNGGRALYDCACRKSPQMNLDRCRSTQGITTDVENPSTIL